MKKNKMLLKSTYEGNGNSLSICLISDPMTLDTTPDMSISRPIAKRRPGYCTSSLDKKEIFIRCFEEGKTIVEAAAISGLNKNTAASILTRYKNDDCVIVTRKRGGKRNGKITDEILNEIEGIIERNACITLKNISNKILENKNVHLSATSINNALKRLRITLKSATMNLDRLNAPSTIHQRKEYALNFSLNAPVIRENIVFIDESGFNHHLRRNKARSKRNTEAHVIIPTVRGRNVSLIGAMNLHGIIHKKIITNCNVNASIFIQFLDELFQKLDEANITGAWLVLDNCTIHKTQEVQEKVRSTSHTIIYLPPYSPMLNPIEKVFSKTKMFARNLLAESGGHSNLVEVIQLSLATITQNDCNNYYVDMTMKLPLAATEQELH